LCTGPDLDGIDARFATIYPQDNYPQDWKHGGLWNHLL